jgi:heme oxygenase
MQSWMLARLRRETQYLLVVANNDRLQPLNAPPTVDSYRSYLARIWGFETAVAAAVARTPGIEDLLDLRGHNRLPLLAADLAALGISHGSTIPSCTAIPALGDAGNALGWLFAVDHASLVHGQIQRHLEKHLGNAARIAGSYLAAGNRLPELGTALDRFATDPAIDKIIVEAATAAFRAQHRWFSASHSVFDRSPRVA